MGQNESAEHLYQPQILRDARQREGDGAHEEPSEISPERDIVVQRKKQTNTQQPNKESFGIKLNNLNPSGQVSSSADAPSNYSKKHAAGPSELSNKKGKQVSVSEFIEEQKRAAGAVNFYNDVPTPASFKYRKD